MKFKDFKLSKYFQPVVEVRPHDDKVKYDVTVLNNDFFVREGITYVFVIDEQIYAVGSSITSIAKRMGKTPNTKDGEIFTSQNTKGFFYLECAVKLVKKCHIYGYFPSTPKYEVFGKEFEDFIPPSKTAESEFLHELHKTSGLKPLGNTSEWEKF